MLVMSSQAFAQVSGSATAGGFRYRLAIEPTEDRWITFMDGGKMNHGMEASYLILQKALDSGNYIVSEIGSPSAKILTAHTGSLNLKTAAQDEDAVKEELKKRMPNIDWDKVLFQGHQVGESQLQSENHVLQVMGLANAQGLLKTSTSSSDDLVSKLPVGNIPTVQPHIRIRPRLETLLYASGRKGNRVVYGFDKETLNPFNAGRAGSIDNEFVTPFQAGEKCPVNSTLNSPLEATGYGPWKSNFGFSLDEGIEFSVLGFGFGFKYKSYQIKTQWVFEVEWPALKQKKDFVYETKAYGKDIGISGQYSGWSVGVEVQKRKTLREALNQVLPQVLDEIFKVTAMSPWTTEVVSLSSWGAMIRGDHLDGLAQGTTLWSDRGYPYQVVATYDGISLIQPYGHQMGALVGMKLFSHSQEALKGTLNQLTLASSKPASAIALAAQSGESVEGITGIHSQSLELPQLTQPQEVESLQAVSCQPKKRGWIERMLESVLVVYGLIRYETLYDASADASVEAPQGVTVQSATPGLRVALISTGISPKEKELKGMLLPGFDFLSWDPRPADVLGAGTTEAVYLKKNSKVPFEIVPVKVFGPQGETHSAALYSSFEWLAKRQDIQLVVIPFSPKVKSQAYVKGIELLVQSGKTVIAPDSIQIAGVERSPSSSKEIELAAFESKVKLNKESVGVLQRASLWLQKNSLVKNQTGLQSKTLQGERR